MIQSKENMIPITIKKDGEFNNRFGIYKHNDIIGKEFGTKVSHTLLASIS